MLVLCDLADSIHYRADVNPQETQWVHDLRSAIRAGFVPQQIKQEVKEASPTYSPEYGYEHQAVYEPPVETSQPAPEQGSTFSVFTPTRVQQPQRPVKAVHHYYGI